MDVARGAANTIALELSPVIAALSNDFVDNAGSAKSWSVEIVGAIDMIVVSMDLVVAGFNGIVAGLLAVESTAKKIQLLNNMFDADRAREISKEIDQIDAAMKRYIDATNPNRVNSLFNQLQAARRSSEDRAQQSFESNQKNRLGNVDTSFFDLQKEEKETEKLSVEIDKLNSALMYQTQLLDEIKTEARDTFKEFVLSVSKGQSAMESLKRTALNVIESIAGNLINVSMGGQIGGGIGGMLAGLISNAFGATVTATSGSMAGQQVIPSFAVGTNYVPQDMLANIHKGEMIIPAREAEQMRRGGGGNNQTVNQTINVSAGVSQTVRAEIARLLPQIRQMAISGVADNGRRNLQGAF
jgi:hypothetical protein